MTLPCCTAVLGMAMLPPSVLNLEPLPLVAACTLQVLVDGETNPRLATLVQYLWM